MIDKKDGGETSHLEVDDKKDVVEVSHFEVAAKLSDDVETGNAHLDIDHGIDPVLLKRTMRKVDLRVVPILIAMYSISLIDRNNLSLARAANEMKMHKQLRLDLGSRFTIITLMFFVTYIIFEIPSQVGLRKFGARWWLGTATVVWGIIMLSMGFAKKWTDLVAQRAILGIFESCLFPGAAYLIACWYPRKQMASRNSIFFCTSAVCAGLAGIMTWGISQMDGTRGLAGWCWIFIICGIITIVIGLLGWLLIVDFPDRANFLTEEERKVVTTRIQRDRADAVPDVLNFSKIIKYSRDLKLWIWGYLLCCATMGAYSLAYFQPRILATMGFNNMESQILTCPPTVWTMIQTVSLAYVADRTKWRGQMIVVNALTMITGTMIYSQLPMSQKGARYFGLFLASAGSNGNVPLVVSWSQANIRSQSKRAFCAALVIAWGGIGGIIASVSFLEREATRGYPTGVWLTVAMNVFAIIMSAGLKLWMIWANRRADRGEFEPEGNAAFRYQ